MYKNGHWYCNYPGAILAFFRLVGAICCTHYCQICQGNGTEGLLHCAKFHDDWVIFRDLWPKNTTEHLTTTKIPYCLLDIHEIYRFYARIGLRKLFLKFGAIRCVGLNKGFIKTENTVFQNFSGALVPKYGSVQFGRCKIGHAQFVVNARQQETNNNGVCFYEQERRYCNHSGCNCAVFRP